MSWNDALVLNLTHGFVVYPSVCDASNQQHSISPHISATTQRGGRRVIHHHVNNSFNENTNKIDNFSILIKVEIRAKQNID